MSNKKFIIVTRKSKLALKQTEIISSELNAVYPEHVFETMGVTTAGDKNKEASLAKLGGKGLFTKELDSSVLSRDADFAINCAKDMPYQLPKGLIIAATPTRESALDAFVSAKYKNIQDLPKEAIVGTASLRRRAFLLQLRPDLNVKLLRGNLDTRINKMLSGEYAAIVLAVAGLERLGYKQYLNSIFPPEQMLPAVGQGALALVCHEDDVAVKKLLSLLHDDITYSCILAERTVLKELNAGCNMSIAAHAKLEHGSLTLTAWVSAADGTNAIQYTTQGILDNPLALGKEVAAELVTRGASLLLDSMGKSPW